MEHDESLSVCQNLSGATVASESGCSDHYKAFLSHQWYINYKSAVGWTCGLVPGHLQAN